MSLSRKRRRSQAFGDESEKEEAAVEAEASIEERQAAVWDALREEHFEAIEQMPLTLHRQYTLMRELDEQAQGYSQDLLPMLKNYIYQRRVLAQHPSLIHNSASISKKATPEPSAVETAIIMTTPLTAHQGLLSESVPHTPSSINVPPERQTAPRTTREILSHIAWLSEEWLRASEEKVNLAKAADDSVDRHIRLLDQAIREQEASIAMGIRPGTHAATIVLPDIVIPRPARKSRTNLSPIPGVSTGEDMLQEHAGLSGLSITVPGNISRKGRRGRRKTIGTADTTKGKRSIKLTLPADPAAIVGGGNVLPSQEIFCFCQRISFGDMIGCDGHKCRFEWFHLECLGLTEIPEEESWVCSDCIARTKGSRRR